MNRLSKALVIVVVSALGLWGCAQSASQPAAVNPERVKTLEKEYAKLQDDYRSVAAARDQARKKVADLQTESDQLKTEVETLQTSLTRERDDLKVQLTTRAAEREAILNQFEQFRRSLRTLLQQADTAANDAPGTPVLTLSEPAPEPEPAPGNQ